MSHSTSTQGLGVVVRTGITGTSLLVALACSAAIGAGGAALLFRWQAAEAEARREAERASLHAALASIQASLQNTPMCRLPSAAPSLPAFRSSCQVPGIMLLDVEEQPAAGAYRMFGVGTQLDAFQVVAGNVDIVWGWSAACGRAALDLSGLVAGELRTSLPTKPGARYRVHYALAANPDPGTGRTTIKHVLWRFDGAVVEEQRFDARGRTPQDMGWVERAFDVTATNAVSVLSVSTTNDSNSGPAIDHVWWEELSSSD